MKTTPYRRGYTFQRRVLVALAKARWVWFVVAGSRGPADVLALRPGRIALIQVKKNGQISPRDRADLLSYKRLSTDVVVVRSAPRTRKLEVRAVDNWGDGWRPFSSLF